MPAAIIIVAMTLQYVVVPTRCANGSIDIPGSNLVHIQRAWVLLRVEKREGVRSPLAGGGGGVKCASMMR